MRIGARPLTASEVIDIAVQVADALDVAHAKGITHRDIKPANLMLTERGHVKVLDFGIAKMTCADTPGGHDDWSEEPRTAAGRVIGSGPYMSPEQVVGGQVDPRSDVFSLGVVVYQMATGQLPFPAATREEMMERILDGRPIRSRSSPATCRRSWNGSCSSVSRNAPTAAISRRASC